MAELEKSSATTRAAAAAAAIPLPPLRRLVLAGISRHQRGSSADSTGSISLSDSGSDAFSSELRFGSDNGDTLVPIPPPSPAPRLVLPVPGILLGQTAAGRAVTAGAMGRGSLSAVACEPGLLPLLSPAQSIHNPAELAMLGSPLPAPVTESGVAHESSTPGELAARGLRNAQDIAVGLQGFLQDALQLPELTRPPNHVPDDDNTLPSLPVPLAVPAASADELGTNAALCASEPLGVPTDSVTASQIPLHEWLGRRRVLPPPWHRAGVASTASVGSPPLLAPAQVVTAMQPLASSLAMSGGQRHVTSMPHQPGEPGVRIPSMSSSPAAETAGERIPGLSSSSAAETAATNPGSCSGPSMSEMQQVILREVAERERTIAASAATSADVAHKRVSALSCRMNCPGPNFELPVLRHG